MNELVQVFENTEFGKIRVVMIDDEPWFVGRDVAEILGYAETAKSIRTHVDEDDKGASILDTPGGKQEMTVINESGLYSLIFGSKLPKAKAFKKWVTSEVLPQIRKTGSYQKPMTQAEILAYNAQLLVEQERKLKEQETRLTSVESLQEKQSTELEALNKRIDILNGTNIEGTPRQIVNGMVRGYAIKTGISFQEAWKSAYTVYNLSYHTNLKVLANNYAKKHGMKSCSRLEYLEKTGKMDDLIKAVDKLINTF